MATAQLPSKRFRPFEKLVVGLSNLGSQLIFMAKSLADIVPATRHVMWGVTDTVRIAG